MVLDEDVAIFQVKKVRTRWGQKRQKTKGCEQETGLVKNFPDLTSEWIWKIWKGECRVQVTSRYSACLKEQ